MRLHPDVTKENLKSNYERCVEAFHNYREFFNNNLKEYSFKFSKYRSAHSFMFVYCKKHKILFKTTASNLKNRCGCPKCGINKKRLNTIKLNESKRIPESQYVNMLSEVNPYVELVGVYKGYKSKTEHRCRLCGSVSLVYPTAKLRGSKNICCREYKGDVFEGLYENTAKLYTFKITKGRSIAYKLGVTTRQQILGSGTVSRYSYREDLDSISELEWVEIDTLTEALRIEKFYKFNNNQNTRYRGRKRMLKNMGKTELFRFPINLAETLYELDKKYINYEVYKERW